MKVGLDISVGSIGVLLLLVYLAGCQDLDDQQAFARRVNADDKHFKGTWIYSTRMGEQHGEPAVTKVNVWVYGRKFRVKAEWSVAHLAVGRGEEEWVSDGKSLWQLLPGSKQINTFDLRGPGTLPFWKMPHRMTPFEPAREIGEDGIAGRRCKVLATAGRYDQGHVTLKYWIDVETSVLLKKDHLLEAGDLVLVQETYECESIQYDPSFNEKAFKPEVPSDWVELEKPRMGSTIMDTKF